MILTARPLRLVVTGRAGQVVSALVEAGAQVGVEIVPIGRPDLDLSESATIRPVLERLRPDVIVSAAAYTAVDKAELELEMAHSINALGPAAIADAARALGVPIIHLSTDYVFDGSKPTPYHETDQTGPLGVYGRTKLAGERGVAVYANHVILRTAWVYSPFGANFVRTMLRLAKTRDQVRVVCDQHGNPTAASDIADGILTVARNLVVAPEDAALRGTFHLAGRGETTWADFAEAVFEDLFARTGRRVSVERIGTADYPTVARRPANSRLDTSLLATTHGFTAKDWRTALRGVTGRLLAPTGERTICA